MRCIVIDDDLASRNALVHLIKQVEYLQLDGVFANSVEGLNEIKKQQPDLVFLDIEMPEMSGMEILENNEMPPTIITTIHKQHALEAFEYNVIDYLVKPISLPRFIMAVEKVNKTFTAVSSDRKDYFFIKQDSILNKVAVKDMLWIEALGDYVIIHLLDRKFVIHLTLKAIESRLPADVFVRIHRSYIINISCIEKIDDATIYIDHQHLPIGIRYKDYVMNRLNLL